MQNDPKDQPCFIVDNRMKIPSTKNLLPHLCVFPVFKVTGIVPCVVMLLRPQNPELCTPCFFGSLWFWGIKELKHVLIVQKCYCCPHLSLVRFQLQIPSAWPLTLSRHSCCFVYFISLFTHFIVIWFLIYAGAFQRGCKNIKKECESC